MSFVHLPKVAYGIALILVPHLKAVCETMPGLRDRPTFNASFMLQQVQCEGQIYLKTVLVVRWRKCCLCYCWSTSQSSNMQSYEMKLSVNNNAHYSHCTFRFLHPS